MNKIIKEKRSRLKILREERRNLISEIRDRKNRKREIETEMAQLRFDIKREKGKKSGGADIQTEQTSAQKTE